MGKKRGPVRVLLVDTCEKAARLVAEATNLSVDWASFGHPLSEKTSHFQLFCHPREYPVIVNDALNAEANWQHQLDELDRITRAGGGAPYSFPASRLSEDLSRFRFGWQVREQLHEAVAGGHVEILFAGPYHEVRMPAWQSRPYSDERVEYFKTHFNQNHWPDSIGSYHAFFDDGSVEEYNHFAGFTAVEFTRVMHQYAQYFERYFDRFAGNTRWYARWRTWDSGGKQLDSMFPICTNSSGGCVGFVRECFLNRRLIPNQVPGLEIVLPNVEGVAERQEAIVFLLTEVLPFIRPKFFPDHWFANYTPRGIVKRIATLSERRTQLEAELARDESAIQTEREWIGQYRAVLRLTGDPLKLLVGKVFHDVFGFEVQDLDAATRKGEPKGADLLLQIGNFHILVEVKGSESASLRQEHLDRFRQQISIHEAAHGQVEAHLLVFNSQARLAPSERSRFAGDLIGLAKESQVAVLSTVELLELAVTRRAGLLGDAQLRALLSTWGEIRSA